MTGGDLTVRRLDPDAWPGIAGRFRDLGHEQTLTYGEAAAARIGAHAQYLVVERAGQPVAAALARVRALPVLGRGIAWIAAGPLISPQEGAAPSPDDVAAILAALRGELVGRQGHVLRLRPAITADLAPEAMDRAAAAAGFAPTDRAAAYLSIVTDIAQPEEALMAALHGKWRNCLRKALKSGLTLEHGPIADLSPRFERLYQEVRGAKGFEPDIPPDFFYGLDGPDFAHEALIARHEGQDIGGMTVGLAGETGVYLFGATTTAEGRRTNAGYFLMWEAYRLAAARGCRRFDLGGIDAEANPMGAQFKRRAGGAEIRAAGPYEARPAGAGGALIGLAETVHGRLKGRRS